MKYLLRSDLTHWTYHSSKATTDSGSAPNFYLIVIGIFRRNRHQNIQPLLAKCQQDIRHPSHSFPWLTLLFPHCHLLIQRPNSQHHSQVYYPRHLPLPSATQILISMSLKVGTALLNTRPRDQRGPQSQLKSYSVY